MKKERLKAIFNLLEDPDESVFQEIRQHLSTQDDSILPWLEKEWNSSTNIKKLKRIEILIADIKFNKLSIDFSNWLTHGTHDIIHGMLLLNRYIFVNFNEQLISKKIDLLSKDIWLELNHNLTALERIRIINHFLFNISKIKVSPQFTISNMFLNSILTNHTANPISIGMLYAHIAQKNNLPVYGVPIADHFILAYLDSPLLQTCNIKTDPILFYIDPTKKGLFLDKIKMEQFFLNEIKNSKTSEELISFRPFPNIIFFRYWISFIIKLFKYENDSIKVEQLSQLLNLLDTHISSKKLM
jgi:hypothetical protein